MVFVYLALLLLLLLLAILLLSVLLNLFMLLALLVLLLLLVLLKLIGFGVLFCFVGVVALDRIVHAFCSFWYDLYYNYLCGVVIVEIVAIGAVVLPVGVDRLFESACIFWHSQCCCY